jgi:hypothetical protein
MEVATSIHGKEFNRFWGAENQNIVVFNNFKEDLEDASQDYILVTLKCPEVVTNRTFELPERERRQQR